MRAQTLLVALVLVQLPVLGQEWPGFRGPTGDGIATDTAFPSVWSSKKNLLWKTSLPGAGSSSPVIFKNKVFVTCFSWVDSKTGAMDQLQRHLICMEAKTGKVQWQATEKAILPEDAYQGFITQHGYASSTPVTDGEAIYVFFGKSGVFAFDYSGKKLWQQSVGKMSANRKWGSAASPILYKNLLIINAAEESRAFIALDKTTGKEVWKAEASRLELCYATPLLGKRKDGTAELLIAVPGEVWGLDPEKGKLLWHCNIPLSGNISPSLVQYKDMVVGMGGFPQTGTAAVRIGSKGNTTLNAFAWSIPDSSYVPSPVVKGENLYWVNDRGLALCVEAETGKVVYKERLGVGQGVGLSRGVYASVVLAGERMIAVTRTEGAFVMQFGPPLKILSHNKLDDDSDFNASPAISQGRIYLRSNKAVYCLGQ